MDNDSALRSRFVTDLGKRFPVDDRAELKWMLGAAIHRDRKARTLTLSQEVYIKDLVERYASHVSAGHTRKYDTPMEEGLRLSHDDCPAPNSDAADQMAPKKPIYMSYDDASAEITPLECSSRRISLRVMLDSQRKAPTRAM